METKDSAGLQPIFNSLLNEETDIKILWQDASVQNARIVIEEYFLYLSILASKLTPEPKQSSSF
jgi:hypothetical protein